MNCEPVGKRKEDAKSVAVSFLAKVLERIDSDCGFNGDTAWMLLEGYLSTSVLQRADLIAEKAKVGVNAFMHDLDKYRKTVGRVI